MGRRAKSHGVPGRSGAGRVLARNVAELGAGKLRAGGGFGDSDEVGDAELLTAERGVDAGGKQELTGTVGGAGPGGEGGAKGFAALGEGGVDEGEQRLAGNT